MGGSYPRLTRPEPDQRRILGTLPPLVSVASAPRRERILFVHCQFIPWSLSLNPLRDRCQLPPVDPTAMIQRTPPSQTPTACLVKPGVAWADFLGITLGFPNQGLRLQPAATGRPGGAPSGTRLDTRASVEDPNRNRIRSLEGRRHGIPNPVLLGRLWHRRLRRSASESGKLGPGHEAHGGAIAAGRVLVLAILPLRPGNVLAAETRPGKTWERESKRAGRLLFSDRITEFRDQNGELVVTSLF
jgi:hypothetical protein